MTREEAVEQILMGPTEPCKDCERQDVGDDWWAFAEVECTTCHGMREVTRVDYLDALVTLDLSMPMNVSATSSTS